jgi:hypothetical protein
LAAWVVVEEKLNGVDRVMIIVARTEAIFGRPISGCSERVG